MVKVKPTNNQGKISVKTSLEANTYSVKDNMSEYYAKLSERWANSSEIIEGVDYSAKYYANKAKESVDNIGTYKEDVEEIVNSFEADVQTAKTDIENARILSIQDVSNTCASFSATLDDVIAEKTQDLDVIFDSKKEELETLNDEIIDNCKDIIGRVGFNMFDTVIKDHVLTYEESKGLALQGTWVYKNAIAGSRYGYPDFYAKVVEEYNEATNTETINGVAVKVNSNGHKFYDIANKTGIDEFFNTMGIAWFYGIDIANERIFLPRDKYFAVNGVAPVAGNGIAIGYTDGINFAGATGVNSAMGAYKEMYGKPLGTSRTGSNFTPTTAIGLTTDPTKSGIEAHLTANEDKYLYICVGNTESVSSVTDVVEVTTTENDTIPLFTGQYFDFKPNNLSWLKGGEQANNAGIYATCYNELVNVLNGETKYGDLKVVDTSDMIAGIDYSEYWKVNQGEMTFTTPTKISSRSYEDIAPVVGNGIALGLLGGADGTSTGALVYTSEGFGVRTGMYGQPLATKYGSGEFAINYTSGVTTDPTKSGIEAHLVENTKAQLYFKVANAVQNLELLNVGEVLEALADKISRQDCKAYITETYVNGTSWYRVWSDGWIEQGGVTESGKTGTIALLKAFSNTNYMCNLQELSLASAYWNGVNITKTTTTISWDISSQNANSYMWEAKGY